MINSRRHKRLARSVLQRYFLKRNAVASVFSKTAGSRRGPCEIAARWGMIETNSAEHLNRHAFCRRRLPTPKEIARRLATSRRVALTSPQFVSVIWELAMRKARPFGDRSRLLQTKRRAFDLWQFRPVSGFAKTSLTQLRPPTAVARSEERPTPPPLVCRARKSHARFARCKLRFCRDSPFKTKFRARKSQLHIFREEKDICADRMLATRRASQNS
jgi:hypothetical protein